MTVVTTHGIGERIERAFGEASRTTGTSFEYLLQTARRESSLDPNARARTSSATGLFQFIESTWLEVVKESGPELGLKQYAQHIERGRDGAYNVRDAKMRAKILDLRNDPGTASLMAGALTRKNHDHLSQSLGRQPSSGELYMAHFLGARGAEKLITLAEKAPNKSASAVFPAQARANRAIFYGAGGRPRSVADVYTVLSRKHDAVETAIAQAKPTMSGTREATTSQQAAYLAAFAPTRVSSERVQQGWQAAESLSPFDVLFRTDPSTRVDPVGPTFWSAFAAEPGTTSAKAPTTTRQVAAAPEPAPVPVREAQPVTTRARRSEQAAKPAPQPLNLTGFLNYQVTRGPKDLLPPT